VKQGPSAAVPSAGGATGDWRRVEMAIVSACLLVRAAEVAVDAAASVRKLATLDIDAILPGHGDPLTSNANDALRKLAATLQ
jgi:glyoxylase-like metal-dependent hydrolase (beta-lactamase superfamily II)